MNDLNSNKLNLLLDNDIIIKNFYGSSKEKEKIQEKFQNNYNFVLKLTFSEFKRSILKDLVIFFNDLVEFISKRESDDISSQIRDINDFLLGYKKNYGLNAKGRFINYIILIFDKIIDHFINLSSVSPFEITLDLIKNQILDYREIYFKNIEIIKDSLNCPHSEIEPIKYENKFESLNFSCIDCEKEKIKNFLEIFKKEIKLIMDSLISNHIVDILEYILELKNIKDLDGRKHVCMNLVDLFLILNCPEDYIIFTSNYSHFNEICELLNKSIIYLQ